MGDFSLPPPVKYMSNSFWTEKPVYTRQFSRCDNTLCEVTTLCHLETCDQRLDKGCASTLQRGVELAASAVN